MSEDGLSLVFAVPSFVAPDFALDCCAAAVLASALAAALASEACWALALRSSEAFWAARSVEAFCDRVLSAPAAASSGLRCGAGGCGAAEAVRSLPVSVGMLESTSAPKLSFSDDGSGRAGLGCAF